MRRTLAVAIVVSGLVAAAWGAAGQSADAGMGGAAKTAAAAQDWTRFGWNAQRTSFDPNPTGITAADVGSLRRQQVQLPGTVDASADYLHGAAIEGGTHDAFFVTTTYGITLAIDAASGSILWKYTPAGYSSWAGSGQITTSAPVIDPSRRYLYAASPDGRIQKLSVANGHVLWRVSITKLPTREKITSSLNFDRGHVIATTGGYIGDTPPYQGHVAIIDATSGRLLDVWNSLCSNRHTLISPPSCPASDSAIWGRAGAVVVPGSGDLLVATGNAPWNGKTNWGDSVLLLPPNASHLLGNYTPSDTDELNAQDLDLGSTSPVLLTPKLVVQGGKDGVLRLISLARMREPGAHRGDELQMVTVPPRGNDIFTAPAVWKTGSQTWLFATTNHGTGAWTLSGGLLREVWTNHSGGTSPLVAGGLLWAYDPGGDGLRVYAPASGTLITTLDAGPGHWNSPIVVDGRVALPEGSANDHATSGVLDIWRLP
jgi:hypothetical protein